MPKQLEGLELDEVSLVDRPANPEAGVSIYKRGEAPAPTKRQKETDMADNKDGGGFTEALAKAGSPAKKALAASTAIRKMADADIAKSRDAIGDFLAGIEADLGKADRADKLEAAIKAAGGEIVEKDGQVEVKVEKATADDFIEFGGERVHKSAVPEPIRKAFESQQAQIAKMQAEADTRRRIAKAQTDFPNLAGDDSTRAALIAAVEGIDKSETREAVERMLKAASEAADLTRAAGRHAGDAQPETVQKALDDYEKKVGEVAVEKGISRLQAREFVDRYHPELGAAVSKAEKEG